MREITRETCPTLEKKTSGGFTNWKRAAELAGNFALAQTIDLLDSRESSPTINAHREIDADLKMIDLPTQHFVAPTVKSFGEDPKSFLTQIPDGDYYFASIKPGVHLAHCTDELELISFVQQYLCENPNDADREVYISHNGDAVMSGHIIVKNDGEPNTVSCEFTIGDFNKFHRSEHTPEILVNRNQYELNWTFRGDLEADGDWRTDETFACFGGVELSRIEMAQRAYAAITCIPHDDNYFLPGYYEVLLERHGETTHPAFIEANFRGQF